MARRELSARSQLATGECTPSAGLHSLCVQVLAGVRMTGCVRVHPCMRACCEMHVSHACHMHEPGTDARIWTCDVWWAAHLGATFVRQQCVDLLDAA